MKSKTIAVNAIACVFLAAVVCYQTATAPAGRAQIQQAPPPCLGNFATHKEADEFLRTAKIIKSEWISVGVTGAQKIRMEKDGRQEFGIFKSIDQRKPGITPLRTGPEFDFKDSWKFEVGAYELDKLISLNMVPPTVERFHNGKKGSLQLWIDGCITEEERSKKNMTAPDRISWGEQILKQRVFDNLIYNIDRNPGNILITSDWKMLLVDHSRSFKNNGDLRAAKDLTYFSRSMMEALGKLDKKSIKEHAGKYLTGNEIGTLLQRRDKILALYRKVADNPTAVYP